MKKVLTVILMTMVLAACNNVDAEEHKLYDGNVTPQEAEIMQEAHEEFQQKTDYTACDKAADGTAYVIEGNEIVDTFKTKECEK